MLIDEINIKIAAGHGGKGAVAFNKNMMSLGPAGGSGGRGGSVYAEGVSDLSALGKFRFKKIFAAENGRDGRDQFRDGNVGEDLVLKLPVGTVVRFVAAAENELAPGTGTGGKVAVKVRNAAGAIVDQLPDDISIETVGERVLLAKGGIGGRGNLQFKSAHNTSPQRFDAGRPGEGFDLHLELKYIADVGFIGLPNAGKSSMLNVLTRASAKVANYPFTTLEPNLGVYYHLILADIPGLIEGSSIGKGLGIKFLRHIERTGVLFHFISAESLDPAADYKTIRSELGAHNPALLKKPEYLFLSKSDLLSPADIKKRLTVFKKLNPKAIAVSTEDVESIKKVQTILGKMKGKKG